MLFQPVIQNLRDQEYSHEACLIGFLVAKVGLNMPPEKKKSKYRKTKTRTNIQYLQYQCTVIF